FSASAPTEFRASVTLDYDQIVAQLENNLEALFSALYQNEIRARNLLTLALANLVAREVLHELKWDLQDVQGVTPFGAIARDLRQSMLRLAAYAEEAETSEEVRH